MRDRGSTSYATPEFNLSDTEAAYAAGIIDGEGSVMLIAHKGRITPLINMTNTSRALLDWMQERFGGSVHEIRRATQRRRTWYWACGGLTRCLAVADVLLPYAVVKGAQLLTLQAYCRNRIHYLRQVGKPAAIVRDIDREYRALSARLNAA